MTYNEAMRRLSLFIAICALVVSPLSQAGETYSSHAMTMYDAEPVKYGADFTHFDYVNPNAPKGGKSDWVPGAPSTALIPLSPKATQPEPDR